MEICEMICFYFVCIFVVFLITIIGLRFKQNTNKCWWIFACCLIPNYSSIYKCMKSLNGTETILSTAFIGCQYFFWSFLFSLCLACITPVRQCAKKYGFSIVFTYYIIDFIYHVISKIDKTYIINGNLTIKVSRLIITSLNYGVAGSAAMSTNVATMLFLLNDSRKDDFAEESYIAYTYYLMNVVIYIFILIDKFTIPLTVIRNSKRQNESDEELSNFKTVIVVTPNGNFIVPSYFYKGRFRGSKKFNYYDYIDVPVETENGFQLINVFAKTIEITDDDIKGYSMEKQKEILKLRPDNVEIKEWAFSVQICNFIKRIVKGNKENASFIEEKLLEYLNKSIDRLSKQIDQNPLKVNEIHQLIEQHNQLKENISGIPGIIQSLQTSYDSIRKKLQITNEKISSVLNNLIISEQEKEQIEEVNNKFEVKSEKQFVDLIKCLNKIIQIIDKKSRLAKELIHECNDLVNQFIHEKTLPDIESFGKTEYTKSIINELNSFVESFKEDNHTNEAIDAIIRFMEQQSNLTFDDFCIKQSTDRETSENTFERFNQVINEFSELFSKYRNLFLLLDDMKYLIEETNEFKTRLIYYAEDIQKSINSEIEYQTKAFAARMSELRDLSVVLGFKVDMEDIINYQANVFGLSDLKANDPQEHSTSKE